MYSGVLNYPNGTSYEGKWVDGKFEGKGCFNAASEKGKLQKKKRKSKPKKDKGTSATGEDEKANDNQTPVSADTISGTITEEVFLECGENKLYKMTQLYPMANSLPVLTDYNSFF